MNRLASTLLLAALMLTGCTQPTEAIRILENAGYTEARTTGYRWFSCGKDDTYATGFEAIGPTGRRVTGAVCSGLFFKNSTIRFD